MKPIDQARPLILAALTEPKTVSQLERELRMSNSNLRRYLPVLEQEGAIRQTISNTGRRTTCYEALDPAPAKRERALFEQPRRSSGQPDAPAIARELADVIAQIETLRMRKAEILEALGAL